MTPLGQMLRPFLEILIWLFAMLLGVTAAVFLGEPRTLVAALVAVRMGIALIFQGRAHAHYLGRWAPLTSQAYQD